MFSLSETTIRNILDSTYPSYQASSNKDANLGFGFLFYGIVRVLRPERLIVIGSKAGFSVICFALGLKDNYGTTILDVQCYDTLLAKPGSDGLVYFIDPSYSAQRNDPNNWYGIGHWDDASQVQKKWEQFGIKRYVRHFKMTSQEFLIQRTVPQNIDLLYIDGDHSKQGILHDFNAYHPILRQDAVILAHDVDPQLQATDPDTGGYAALQELDHTKFEICRLPVFPGLAIVRKK